MMSKTARGPDTITLSLPARATTSLPLTGTTSIAVPARAAMARSCAEASVEMVESSTRISGRGRRATTVRGPR